MKKIFGNILKYFVLPLLIVFVVVNIIAYYNQEYITFFPQKLSQDFEFNFKRDYEEKYINTASGDRIHVLKFKANGPRKGVVFHSHGNAGNMHTSIGAYLYYVDRGYDYITWDYPEFGKSSGDLEPNTFLQVADEVYETMMQDYTEKDIKILQGHSLGTSVTTYLASKNDVDEVVLLAPFYSIVDMAKHRFPVADWMVTFPLRSNEYVAQIDEPILILHGTADSTIPFEQGERLSKISPNTTFVVLNDYGHNDLEHQPEFRTSMDAVLKRLEHEHH